MIGTRVPPSQAVQPHERARQAGDNPRPHVCLCTLSSDAFVLAIH